MTGVEAGKPAAVGGVKDGDIIISIDGKVIDEEHPLDATLAQFAPGATVSLDVLRDGKHVTLDGHPRDAAGRALDPEAAAKRSDGRAGRRWSAASSAAGAP